MDSKPTMAIFPTRNQEGENLFEKTCLIAESLGFTVKKEYVNTKNKLNYANACQNEDVVVLDASRAPREIHNYDIAYPSLLDHVLVVSRNYLPINFYGVRDTSVRVNNRDIYGTPFYPNEQSNEDIIQWLQVQLTELREVSPRPKDQRGIIGSIFQGMPKGAQVIDRRRNETGQIFISYRNVFDKETGTAVAERVDKLKERIEKGEFHKGESKIARYFPPGVLSAEIMTEQRRWQILSMIDRFIGPANELWVYETDEYYNSWWTLGELATIAYRNKVGWRGNPTPQVRIYNPKTDVVTNVPIDYLPDMTRDQCQRMARWYANTDTYSIGPEAIIPMRVLAQTPILNWFSYFHDHVWSDEFWTYPIIDCKVCRDIGKNASHFDVDTFLFTDYKFITRIAPEQMKNYVKTGEFICPNCKTTYNLKKAPSNYLWFPEINEQMTGQYWLSLFGIESVTPEEFYLVPLPAYMLK